MTQFRRTFSDTREYQEAVQAAEDLGFEPVKFRFNGRWEAEGEPFFGEPHGELEKVGSKYFYFRMTVDDYDRELWRCEPQEHDERPGELVVYFED